MASGLASQEAALASGFVRRADDSENAFYEIIDEFQQFAHTESKALSLSEVGARKLDPEKLMLNYDHNIKIFFLNEGAHFRNQLGIIATGNTNFESIMFSDITCIEDCNLTGYRPPRGRFGTPEGMPLEIGDYYDLGLVKAGTKLDFFLRRDGFERDSTDTWYTNTALNSDGLQHVMAYDFNDYLVLAWEDVKYGGDLDYNDVVFALDFGKENIQQLDSVEIPESPFSVLGYAVVVTAGLVFARRSATTP